MTADRRTAHLFEMLRRVREILADGRKSLTEPHADQWKVLALARWDMLRTLGRLNRCKRLYVLDPIRMHGSEDLTRRARRLVESNLDLLEQYHGFVEHWALTSPLSVDGNYRQQAMRMAERIERQVKVDGFELDALLHDSGSEPTRASASR
jgi:hypothetical protein